MSRPFPLFALLGVFSFACGGSDPTPQTPADQAASATSGATPASTAAPSKLATVLTTDPKEIAAIGSAASKAGAPASGASADLKAGLASIAAKSAPGMAPDGDAVSGTLKEDEHLAWSVMLKPGKCYAIVGWSPSGEISDLDLHVLAPPLYSMLSGEDVTDDNAPVVGAAPNPMCPVADTGMAYKIDVTADKGAGHAAVQLFSVAK